MTPALRALGEERLPGMSYGSLSNAVLELTAVVWEPRLEQNQHWTSDVLAGAILGTTLGKLVTRLNQRKRFGQQGQYQFTLDPQLGLGYQGVRMALKF